MYNFKELLNIQKEVMGEIEQEITHLSKTCRKYEYYFISLILTIVVLVICLVRVAGV